MIEWLEHTSQKPIRASESALVRLAFNQMKLASIVGSLAVLLPIVLLVYGVAAHQFHDTISHFYYSDAFAEEYFVGTLVGVGLIMLAFEGNDKAEARFATIGGILAILVAFLPTDGWILLRDFNITEYDNFPFSPDYPFDQAPGTGPTPLNSFIGTAHVACAVALFSVLAYFCLGIFTRGRFAGQEAETSKKRRNVIYRICGIAIAACIVVIGVGSLLNHTGRIDWWNRWNLTFFFEGLALIAFGISWIVRSRVFGMALLDSDQKKALEILEQRP